MKYRIEKDSMGIVEVGSATAPTVCCGRSDLISADTVARPTPDYLLSARNT